MCSVWKFGDFRKVRSCEWVFLWFFFVFGLGYCWKVLTSLGRPNPIIRTNPDDLFHYYQFRCGTLTVSLIDTHKYCSGLLWAYFYVTFSSENTYFFVRTIEKYLIAPIKRFLKYVSAFVILCLT